MVPIKIPQKIVLRMSTSISLHDRFSKIAESSSHEDTQLFDILQRPTNGDASDTLTDNSSEIEDYYNNRKKTPKQRIVLARPLPIGMRYTNVDKIKTQRISVFERLGYPRNRSYYKQPQVKSVTKEQLDKELDDYMIEGVALNSKTCHTFIAMSGGRALTATVRAVSQRKFKPTKAPIILTEAAVSQVKTLLKLKPNSQGLKIGVKTRGCNGLAYTLDYFTEKSKLDEQVNQDGVTILIDRKAQLSLLGTEMDYVQEPLSSQFVFYNPNIKGTCGCGESFNI
ncbi:DgyrCDS2786 [Dimorphilus gyrociliatus]|uniref:Iron-sulfur cluster assembly 1 homolog, mitochondrial n=1 Tax=Dimorphilus gyrociliatus TaxID=2664684 RepID=A0A7I8VD28_9ANNE|nr:DgyrCDS2786 [Dimorphilus gyrociliatus]